MQINVFLADIFRKVAEKLNKTPQDKQIIETDFNTINDISITSTVANRITTLVVGDSDIQITGSKKAEAILKPIMEKFFYTQLPKSSYVSLGTGDCVLIPVVDKGSYSVDIIGNNDFAILDSVGDVLYSIIARRDYTTVNSNTYTRWDYMGLEEINGIKCCVVRRYAFKGEYGSGVEIPLNSISKWEKIPTETIVTGVDKLLIGRIKCPIVNRNDINSVQGVPITYGLDPVIDEIKNSYKRFNEEYKRKETKIFAKKDLFVKEENKGYTLPNGGVYQFVGGGDLDKNSLPIQEFSPDLHYEDLKGGMDFNLKMLELLSGFSQGIMTPIESSMATATEIKASQNPNFAFISAMRKLIESAVDDLTYAMAMFINASSEDGILGDYSVSYDWDESMMENSNERFQQLLQSKSVGELEDGELMAWVKNIPLEQAKSILSEMETVDTEDVAI